MDNLMRFEGGVTVLGYIISLLPLGDLIFPVAVFGRRDCGQKFCEDSVYVTDEAAVRRNVFADFTWVDVNVNDGRTSGELFGVECDPIAEACSNSNDNICLVYGFVGGKAAVHADHTKVERIIVCKNTGSHNSVACRNVCGMNEGCKLFGCSAAHNAASKVDDRTFGTVDDLCRMQDVLLYGHRRFRNLDRSGPFKLCFCGGDILGDVNEYRTAAAGTGDPESVPEDVCKLGYITHYKVVFSDGHGDAGDVHLLEAVTTDQTGSDIAS